MSASHSAQARICDPTTDHIESIAEAYKVIVDLSGSRYLSLDRNFENWSRCEAQFQSQSFSFLGLLALISENDVAEVVGRGEIVENRSFDKKEDEDF